MEITTSTSEPATARCDPDGSSATGYGRRTVQATVREAVPDSLRVLVRLLARQAVAEAMMVEPAKTPPADRKHHP
jgi:hypothetical protein